MAPRKYTMVDVTTSGSNVQRYRQKMIDKYPGGSSVNPKGYSSDARMKAMFPTSPLYSGSNDNPMWDDQAIINNFKSYETQIISESFDFNTVSNAAYLGFNHPQSPDFERSKMHLPIENMTGSIDKPYYGHPNIQVRGIDPTIGRTNEMDGLFRPRELYDGGFGTKNELKNYPTEQVRVSIGTFFSNVYSSNSDNNVTDQVNSKINSMGNSTISGSNTEAAKPDQSLSENVNNFKYLSGSL